MSSATNNRHSSLEQEFRSRIEGAEANPPADLWARIDHQLTVQENGRYKSGMAFYRQLAAACVGILLLACGVAAYYMRNPEPEPSIALQQAASSTPDKAIAQAMQQALQAQEPTNTTGPDAAVAAAPQPTAGAAEPEPRQQTRLAARAPEEGLNAKAWQSMASENQSTYFSRESALPFSLRLKLPAGASSVASGNNRASAPPLAFSQSAAAASAGYRELNEMISERARTLQEAKQEPQQVLSVKKASIKSLGDQEIERQSGRWSLGMAYAPGMFEQNIGIPGQRMAGVSYNSIAGPNPAALKQADSFISDAQEEYKEEIEPGFSFGVELKTGLKLSKKWKLLAGLGFFQNTARSKSSYTIEQFWSNPRSGQKVSQGPTTILPPVLSSNFAADSMHVAKTDDFDVVYRYRYLTLPAGVQYEGNVGKDWFWYAGAGVAANVLLESAVLASRSDVREVTYEVDDSNSPFRKLQWSGSVNAGLGKRLSDNLAVTVGPEYRGYFDTMLANPDQARAPQGKPYTLGVTMAVNYDINPGRR